MANAVLRRSSIARAVVFLGLWLALEGADPAGLPIAVATALAATWISVRLLPPGSWRPQPVALVGLALRFVRQSVVAGADVAWRALDPRLPLRPGFVTHRAELPSGVVRSIFWALTSLQPGTVPSGADESGAEIVHCLDLDQPVAAQLAVEEALLGRALGRGRTDG
jgi:multicomponent Na+:H+ antiporter subunit E